MNKITYCVQIYLSSNLDQMKNLLNCELEIKKLSQIELNSFYSSVLFFSIIFRLNIVITIANNWWLECEV